MNVLCIGLSDCHDTRVLVRALGPSLQSSNAAALDNPTVELKDENGTTLTSNDDWKESPDRAEIEASGLAPTQDKESAVIFTASPAAYTAIVRGKSDTTGVGVVEIYNISRESSAGN